MGSQNTDTDRGGQKSDRFYEEIVRILEFQKSGISDARIDVSQLSEEEEKIGTMINQLVDLFLDEQNSIHEALELINEGSFVASVPKFPGNRSKISDELIKIIKNLSLIQTDISRFSDLCLQGEITTKLDSGKYGGGYQEIIELIDAAFQSVVTPFSLLSEGINQFAEGKIPAPIESSKFSGRIASSLGNLNLISDISKTRGDDIKMLISSAVEGRLDARADPTKYPGYHGMMIEGINKILDAYIGPINLSAEYIDRISKGDIPPRITETYHGDFNEIKNNINALLDVVHMRNEDIKLLIHSGIDGRLDVRADPTKYPGENGKMIEGINQMLDAYIGPINVSAEYLDRISKGDIPPRITDSYRGDFNEIKNNLNALIDVILMRNEDIRMLIQSGIEGRLDIRADPKKYPGENGKMIEGINQMLNAYIGPINVSAEYIDRISKGDHSPANNRGHIMVTLMRSRIT